MTVLELMEKLAEYNPNAVVKVIAHNQPADFSITYGGAEGATKESAPQVGFYVEGLGEKEETGE